MLNTKVVGSIKYKSCNYPRKTSKDKNKNTNQLWAN